MVKRIDIKHVAKLANLPLTEEEMVLFAPQLLAIVDFISKLQALDTKNIKPTSQVTGLMNIFREDKIDAARTFSQEKALANAPKKYKGYFMVPAIF